MYVYIVERKVPFLSLIFVSPGVADRDLYGSPRPLTIFLDKAVTLTVLQ